MGKQSEKHAPESGKSGGGTHYGQTVKHARSRSRNSDGGLGRGRGGERGMGTREERGGYRNSVLAVGGNVYCKSNDMFICVGYLFYLI